MQQMPGIYVSLQVLWFVQYGTMVLALETNEAHAF